MNFENALAYILGKGSTQLDERNKVNPEGVAEEREQIDNIINNGDIDELTALLTGINEAEGMPPEQIK